MALPLRLLAVSHSSTCLNTPLGHVRKLQVTWDNIRLSFTGYT